MHSCDVEFQQVLANIKKHSASTGKMRDLVSTLKRARLHEILEADLAKATDELREVRWWEGLSMSCLS